jgi:hypothetical protein
MKIDYVTSPDVSRGIITIEKLVPVNNKKRVKKVVATTYLKTSTEKLKDLYA